MGATDDVRLCLHSATLLVKANERSYNDQRETAAKLQEIIAAVKFQKETGVSNTVLRAPSDGGRDYSKGLS